MTHKIFSLLYIIAFMLILLIPFAGMALPTADSLSEKNQELRAWPDVYSEDSTLNVSYPSEMGDYFQDHFAFRDHMIMTNSILKSLTFKSNAQEQVIMGQDDWLFFNATTKDYLGRGLLSDRELYSAVHNISLMKDYIEQNGSKLVFTISPNKNSLYGQYMPYNYVQSPDSNARNLKPLLMQAGVAYVDLFEAFGAEKEALYFKRDSHWNNKGAALAYHTLMDALGKTHQDYRNTAWETRTDHIGDIDEMLFLSSYKKEIQYYPAEAFEYVYVNDDDVEDDMSSWIETGNESKKDSLLMYRDSFGESLVPFFAQAFRNAYFSRLVPYDLTDVAEYQPDYVIIQKVERNLIDFVARSAIVPGMIVNTMSPPKKETNSTIATSTDGPYLVIKGAVDSSCLEDESDIFVSIYSEETKQTKTYKTMYLTNEERDGNGYCLYLDEESLPSGNLQIQLIVSGGIDDSFVVQSEEYINKSGGDIHE